MRRVGLYIYCILLAIPPSDEAHPRRADDLGSRYLACRTSDDPRIWRRRRTRSRKLHRPDAQGRRLERAAHLGKNPADDRYAGSDDEANRPTKLTETGLAYSAMEFATRATTEGSGRRHSSRVVGTLARWHLKAKYSVL